MMSGGMAGNGPMMWGMGLFGLVAIVVVLLLAAALAAALLVLRTSWEDRLLRAELPGYDDYRHRVRWRLVPGVW